MPHLFPSLLRPFSQHTPIGDAVVTLTADSWELLGLLCGINKKMRPSRVILTNGGYLLCKKSFMCKMLMFITAEEWAAATAKPVMKFWNIAPHRHTHGKATKDYLNLCREAGKGIIELFQMIDIVFRRQMGVSSMEPRRDVNTANIGNFSSCWSYVNDWEFLKRLCSKSNRF